MDRPRSFARSIAATPRSSRFTTDSLTRSAYPSAPKTPRRAVRPTRRGAARTPLPPVAAAGSTRRRSKRPAGRSWVLRAGAREFGGACRAAKPGRARLSPARPTGSDPARRVPGRERGRVGSLWRQAPLRRDRVYPSGVCRGLLARWMALIAHRARRRTSPSWCCPLSRSSW